jgi:hypothetical protein
MKGRKKRILTSEELILKNQKRTIQNKINKRNQRLRDKLKNKLLLNNENDYTSNLIDYFNGYEFDFHITGTFNPINTNSISYNSLKTYSEKYIQTLIDNNIINYGLIFIDNGDNKNIHTHILIKTINNNISTNKIKTMWLLGYKMNLNRIESEIQKFNTIKYGFNKMKKNDRFKTLWSFIY